MLARAHTLPRCRPGEPARARSYSANPSPTTARAQAASRMPTKRNGEAAGPNHAAPAGLSRPKGLPSSLLSGVPARCTASAPGTQRAVGVLSTSKSLARKRNCRLRGRTWRRGKWAAGGSVAGWCRWCCPSTPPVRVPARASAGLGRHAPACEARAVACIFITAALTARRRCAPCCWQTRGGAAGVPGRLCACSPAAAACSDEGRLLARDERVGRRVRGPQR